jgi:hypothetical protein
MTIGSSIFLIAVGAILKYAVTETIAGINLQVAGVILMVVGVVGLLFAVLVSARSWWSGYPPPRDSL